MTDRFYQRLQKSHEEMADLLGEERAAQLLAEMASEKPPQSERQAMRMMARFFDRVADLLPAEDADTATTDKHCPTCICSKRAPVQASDDSWLPSHRRRPHSHPAGTITWAEHLEAHAAYKAKWRNDQTAERLAERGGFGYEELMELLGHEPKTWEPWRAPRGVAP